MIGDITQDEAGALFQVLTFIAPLSQELSKRLLTHLKKEALPKRYMLITPGQVARRIYFILSGFARAYYIDEEGHEHTRWFMGVGDVMISVYSFFTQQPGDEYIELLEDSLLLSLTWDQLQLIYIEHPEFNYVGRVLTERYYIQSEERLMLLRTKKPLERYNSLLKDNPQWLQKSPLNAIASYLGMTQETLSRVRSMQR